MFCWTVPEIGLADEDTAARAIAAAWVRAPDLTASELADLLEPIRGLWSRNLGCWTLWVSNLAGERWPGKLLWSLSCRAELLELAGPQGSGRLIRTLDVALEKVSRVRIPSRRGDISMGASASALTMIGPANLSNLQRCIDGMPAAQAAGTRL